MFSICRLDGHRSGYNSLINTWRRSKPSTFVCTQIDGGGISMWWPPLHTSYSNVHWKIQLKFSTNVELHQYQLKWLYTCVTPASNDNRLRCGGRQCFLPPSAQHRFGKQSTLELQRCGKRSCFGGAVHCRYCSSIRTATEHSKYIQFALYDRRIITCLYVYRPFLAARWA